MATLKSELLVERLKAYGDRDMLGLLVRIITENGARLPCPKQYGLEEMTLWCKGKGNGESAVICEMCWEDAIYFEEYKRRSSQS